MRRDAQPGRPGTASGVVKARRVSNSNVSKGAATSIVGEEKVHTPMSSVQARVGQHVALLAAGTKAGLYCNGSHGVGNIIVRSGGAAALQTMEEMDPERVKRPAALAGRVCSRAELRQAKAHAQGDREQVAGELKRSDDRRRRRVRYGDKLAKRTISPPN